MNQLELWIGLVNLKPLHEASWDSNVDLIPGAKDRIVGAWTNIVTWAVNVEGFRQKTEIIAAELKMYVLDIEKAEPLSERRKNWSLTEEIDDMIQRAEFNPDAIVYGTFYTYSSEDA
jgi:hypothetical protein